MEIVNQAKSITKKIRVQSSFECDSATIDIVLGRCVLGNAQLRADSAESRKPSQLTGRHSQVYAPMEVVPKATTLRNGADTHRKGTVQATDLQCELGSDLKRERLFRLLERQQACYDAEQQAAAAAEQLLSLCEHHQQQWLPSPQNQPVQ